MPTFIDWCAQVVVNLEHEIDRVEDGGDTFGRPIDYLDHVRDALDKVESAILVYKTYIESTQIEELADLEGVGE